MNKCNLKSFVVTHVVYRKIPPIEPIEGPFSADSDALLGITKKPVEVCQIPIANYNDPIIYGEWKKNRKFKMPSFLGTFLPLKYVLDTFLVIFFLFRFVLKNRSEKMLVAGIDPLSCLPLTLFKNIFGYKLIFHSVDFNKNRFKQKFLQKLYEKADEISTKKSDQVWVVCESLLDYKRKKFGVESFYLPNSTIYNESFYKKGKKYKNGKKIAWTGSFLTERSYDLLFGLLSEIQKEIIPYAEFYFAPTRDHERFKQYAERYKLNNFEVLNLHSRLEWQEFAGKCDIGIAIYDERFGSTEFIEPTKIWDFMLCGMPFIMSCEPSVSTPVKKSGVAYFLNPGNKIPKDNSLSEFLKPENIKNKQKKCLEIAKQFDIKQQIQKNLSSL